MNFVWQENNGGINSHKRIHATDYFASLPLPWLLFFNRFFYLSLLISFHFFIIAIRLGSFLTERRVCKEITLEFDGKFA